MDSKSNFNNFTVNNNSDNVVRSTVSPKNVGIISMAAYFPKTYVSQDELESYDATNDPDPHANYTGKYTKGLMQDKMGFCTDLEDIHSIALTVTQQLLEKSDISYHDIGFLEVGTETIVDKSKSVKTVLMDLIKPSGNTDIEGADATNACYGGTAALFHALDWCEKDSWDGRYAIVVAADIAVYAPTGGARPTGGCGAIAMLIGRNAPLVFDFIRATHADNVYDFFKGDLSSEYPQVVGKLSLQTYISAIDNCYQTYRKKFINNKNEVNSEQAGVILNQFDAILCHSPYCKLVRKAIARLLFNEYLSNKSSEFGEKYQELEKYSQLKRDKGNDETIENKDLEKVLITLSEELYQNKTQQSLYIANQVGNMYTASLYSCLISYLTCKPIDQVAGKRLLFFSYGSGAIASMFSARLAQDGASLRKLLSSIEEVRDRLKDRLRITPQEYTDHLKHRELTHGLPNRKPTGYTSLSNNKSDQSSIINSAHLYPGTYYLTSVDKMYRRKYERLPLVENNNNEANAVMSKAHVVAPPQNTGAHPPEP